MMVPQQIVFVPRDIDTTYVLSLPEMVGANAGAGHLRVYVEDGARVTIHDDQIASHRKVHCYIGSHAQVTYIHTNKRASASESNIEFFLQQQSMLNCYALFNRSVTHSLQVWLQGVAACADVQMLVVARDKQKYRFNTMQRHQAQGTSSSLVLKSMVHDAAHTEHHGLIEVDADAQRTDALQKSNHLLCADRATAYALPALEVQADDVQCAHGSAIGSFDEQMLFYLQSRGLSGSLAKRLLTDAFFHDVMPKEPAIRGLFAKILREGALLV